jgi:hypothetical protein
MKRLNDEITRFFQNQGCVIVSTIDKNGFVHNACKGIIKINRNGKIYVLDLYRGKTFENLNANSHISITSIDEHKFTGYCLKGRAEVVTQAQFSPDIIKAWEAKITSRLTQRLLKNMKEEKGHPRHPEVLLPQPQYMIAMEIEEIVDLTPHHLR